MNPTTLNIPAGTPPRYRALFALADHVASSTIGLTHTPDCCIAATRVCCEVLRRFGFAAVRPLPVKVMIFNPPLALKVSEHAAAHGGAAPSNETILGWQTGEPGGCWGIGLGFGGPQPGKYAGHLVCLAGQYLLDPTLGQANRPARQISGLKPLLLRHGGEAFLAGRERETVLRTDGTVLAYEVHRAPWAGDWQRSPDWTKTRRTAGIIHETVKALRGRYGLK